MPRGLPPSPCPLQKVRMCVVSLDRGTAGVVRQLLPSCDPRLRQRGLSGAHAEQEDTSAALAGKGPEDGLVTPREPCPVQCCVWWQGKLTVPGCWRATGLGGPGGASCCGVGRGWHRFSFFHPRF